jgi:hypothetical protein
MGWDLKTKTFGAKAQVVGKSSGDSLMFYSIETFKVKDNTAHLSSRQKVI